VKAEPVTFEYDFDKVLAALVYFAANKKVTLFDKKKAFSLLFLADKAHLLRYGEPIFGDYYGAPELGAVPQNTWRRLNRFCAGQIHGKDIERLAQSLRLTRVRGHEYEVLVPKDNRPNLDALSELERESLDEIATKYGAKSFEELHDPIHPKAWENAARERRKGKPAPAMRFEDFFDDEPEALGGSKEHMLEEFRFRQALSGRRS
jgi:antitoxin SocA-like protein